MSNKQLLKQVYNKDKFTNTVDISFSQLINTENSTINQTTEINIDERIENFFNDYEELFFFIEKNGDINSHEYLVKKSSEYINYKENLQDIQDLLDEITLLRTELLDLKKQSLNE